MGILQPNIQRHPNCIVISDRLNKQRAIFENETKHRQKRRICVINKDLPNGTKCINDIAKG